MILQGNCLDKLKELPDNSIDAIVTDPPYELGFMGKSWDNSGIANNKEMWKECLRVLKHGGYLLAFGGTRTYHRMASAIEDAGFEIRDSIDFVYGSGFPKSLSVEKQLTKKYLNECGYIDVYEQNGITETTKKIPKYLLRLMSETNISKEESDKKTEGKILQSELQKQSISESRETTNNVWREKPCMERWNYIKTTERELQRCKVCAMSERVFIDGEERWVCNGTPFSYGKSDWKDSKKRGDCSSYRPQSIEQQQGQSNVIPKQYCSQNIRSYEQEYKGIGTALKPAHEPICMARKPIAEKTVAENVLKYGTGGINIDESRVTTTDNLNGGGYSGNTEFIVNPNEIFGERRKQTPLDFKQPTGRFPANLIHDGSEEVLKEFPQTKTGGSPATDNNRGKYGKNGMFSQGDKNISYANFGGDSGSASRFFKQCEFTEQDFEYAPFFYCAKASKGERNNGMEQLEDVYECGEYGNGIGNVPKVDGKRPNPVKNYHPTVKPLKLMEYLIKMVTPKGGVVLDPFAGSGTTLVASKKLGYKYIGIELTKEYIPIIEARLEAVK